MTTVAPADSLIARLAALLERLSRGQSGSATTLLGSTPLRSLDLDSATLLTFLVSIEEEFGIEWDDELPEEALSCLDAIAAYITTAANRGLA